MLTSFIYVLSLLGVLALTALDRRNLLYCYLFFVPWFGLMFDAGVTISMDRLIAVGMLVVFLSRRRKFIPGALVAFFAYAIVDTTVMSQFLPELASAFSPVRGTYRWIGQLVIWTLYLVPAAYIPTVWESGMANRAAQILVVSVSMLCCLGLVQFAVYKTTGVDIFPIGMMDPNATDATMRTGMLSLHGEGSTLFGAESIRISALGGEPKDLAYSIVVALDILLIDTALGGLLRLSTTLKRTASTLLLMTLLLTFSTQGLALFGADLVVLMVGLQLVPRQSRRSPAARLLLGMFMLVAVVYLTPGLASVLNSRTVERMNESGALEDYNQAVGDWLMDNPTYSFLGAGLGNVHLYAMSYVPEEFWYYMHGTVFVAKSGSLRLISELGFVGLFLFGFLQLGPLQSWRRYAATADPMVPHCALLCALVTINFMPSAAGPLYVFICSGLLYGALRQNTARQPAFVDQARPDVPQPRVASGGI